MRPLLLVLLLLCLDLPALSQTKIDDLLISRDGEVINIRVSARNSSTTNQKGPVRIDLSVRPVGGQEWQPIHSWSNISGLGAGQRVSRDFFSEEGDAASALAAQGLFEVRATLSGPNLSDTVEKTADHDHDHDH